MVTGDAILEEYLGAASAGSNCGILQTGRDIERPFSPSLIRVR